MAVQALIPFCGKGAVIPCNHSGYDIETAHRNLASAVMLAAKTFAVG